MAPASNWLSFSLMSPMEMLRTTAESESPFVAYDTSTASPNYFLDNYYANGWTNNKSQGFFTDGGEDQNSERPHTDFIDAQSHHQAIPKLEDFLGDSSMVRYSDTQTETTQDSSLTQIYTDHGSAYFGGGDHHHHHHHQQQPQDLKAITGFQTFSANSGSEVEDSASVALTQLACGGEFTGHSTESTQNELGGGYSSAATNNALSLAVTNTNNSQSSSAEKKAIVPADNDGSKKLADTFGQRTSIYRGVTR